MANLIIVESPAKANTIKGYLGQNYKVIACKGHVRDLPKSSLGIDVENGFTPHYINIRGKGDVIKELKNEAKTASKIFLATDPDREGEAISWHIAEQLGIPHNKACRVTFNEITKNAVKNAIKNPRVINEDLVNSQQARRILDRLVGFKLSEVLWKNVKSGLSGGRVQSVATRIIIEREEEIRNFVPQEYWTIETVLSTDNGENISVRLFGDKNNKIKISNDTEATEILNKLSNGEFVISSVKHAEKYKQPSPPFTTSSLLQDASKKLGFQSQKIMKVAQELYDGINLGAESGGFQGLITYMRTDSTRISSEAQISASKFIQHNYGTEFLPKSPRLYKSAMDAQDAHEAIRPSDPYITPKSVKKMLTPDQFKLYKLIWERFIASQMESAVLDTVAVDINNGDYVFKTGGYAIKSKGFLAVYDSGEKEDSDIDGNELDFHNLPNLKNKQKLIAREITKQQHFTEPPARYTEASLIDFFKENGIGRPSTYAPIISIIISREYVKRDGKSLAGTPLGEATTNFMRKHFPDIIDYEFTASMETKLDSIENKENDVVGVLSEFYDKFALDLEKAMTITERVKIESAFEESEFLCEKCGNKLVYKKGRFGKFLACSNYPACKNTKSIDSQGNIAVYEPTVATLAGFACDACGGEMVVRDGKFGVFYACQNYPRCKFTKQKTTDTDVSCPKCNSKVFARHGKGKMLFYSCEKYPECDFSTWDMPLNEKCPDCGQILYYKKSRKLVLCKEKDCDYKREEEMTVIE